MINLGLLYYTSNFYARKFQHDRNEIYSGRLLPILDILAYAVFL